MAALHALAVTSPRRLSPRRAAVLGVLLVVALNVPGLRFAPGRSLAEDPDTPQILAAVRRDMSPAGLASWFVRDWPFGNSFYRPLVALSYAGDLALYGDRAAGYRFTNWALATLAALAVLAWMGVWTGSVAAGVAAGAVFSLRQAAYGGPLGVGVVLAGGALLATWLLAMRVQGQPSPLLRTPWLAAAVVALTVEWYANDSAVTWIATRTAVLGCLCVVGAAACAARYERTGRVGSYAAMVGLGAAGLASYEQAVMVVAAPLAMLLVARGQRARRLLHALAGLACLVAVYGAVRLAVVGSTPSGYQLIQLKSSPAGALREETAYVLAGVPVARDVWTRADCSGWLAALDGLFWYDLALLAAWLTAYVRGMRVAPLHVAALMLAKALFLAPMSALHVFPHYLYLPEAASAGLAACLLWPYAFVGARSGGHGGRPEEEPGCVSAST